MLSRPTISWSHGSSPSSARSSAPTAGSDPTACGVRASEAVPGAARGGIPAQSVAIEITPKFLVQFLDKEYAGQFQDVEQAFFSLGSIDEFPEMRALLSRLWPRSGGPEHSELCYEGKALEI